MTNYEGREEKKTEMAFLKATSKLPRGRTEMHAQKQESSLPGRELSLLFPYYKININY
jgi:hypothetical protein